jgi:hypothetical protein
MHWDCDGEECWYVLRNGESESRIDLQSREDAFEYARYREDRE